METLERRESQTTSPTELYCGESKRTGEMMSRDVAVTDLQQ